MKRTIPNLRTKVYATVFISATIGRSDRRREGHGAGEDEVQHSQGLRGGDGVGVGRRRGGCVGRQPTAEM